MYKNTLNIAGKQKTLITINHEQEQQTESKKVDSLHHIHVIDRSGSMSREISQLIENVKTTIQDMGDEDYVSIVWFSGESQCKTLIKGAKKDESLNKLLDSIKSTVGLTCFSTPLKEVNEIISDLMAIHPNVSVTLFTDGEPCLSSWSYAEEDKRIFAEIAKMKNNVLALNTIGYGYYYNQDLLRRMAQETMFGSAIHSSQINEYTHIFQANYEKVSDLLFESAEVVAPLDSDIVYLNSTSTKLSRIGTMNLSRLENKKNQFFILADGEFDFMYNGEVIKTRSLTKPAQPATVMNFLYAYAYELHYAGERQEALSIMSNNIKDKYFIDTQLNSFTYDEVSKFRKELKKAVIKPKERFIEGEAPDGYLPKDNALCVMDILGMLSEGTNFYIPSKNYQRIGQKTSDNFNLFKSKDDEVKSLFKDFVFNKKHLNVSISFTVRGTVALNAKAATAVGLPKEVDSQIFRTHTIIKDGNLNMQTIDALLDGKTLQRFTDIEKDENVKFMTVHGSTSEDLFRVTLDLSVFPTINKTYVNDSGSIDNVMQTVARTTELEAQQKVLNFYIKEAKTKSVEAARDGKFSDLTDEQIEVLKQHGLDKNFTYGGVDVQKEDAVDYYESRVLEFYLKGFSSLPSVNDVMKKVEEGKKLNEAGQIMHSYIKELENKLTLLGLDLYSPSAEVKSFLEAELEEVKEELFKERVKMNSIKIAKVLTGDWFSGLEVDDKGNQTYTNGNRTLVVKAERVKVYF